MSTDHAWSISTHCAWSISTRCAWREASQASMGVLYTDATERRVGATVFLCTSAYVVGMREGLRQRARTGFGSTAPALQATQVLLCVHPNEGALAAASSPHAHSGRPQEVSRSLEAVLPPSDEGHQLEQRRLHSKLWPASKRPLQRPKALCSQCPPARRPVCTPVPGRLAACCREPQLRGGGRAGPQVGPAPKGRRGEPCVGFRDLDLNLDLESDPIPSPPASRRA